MPVLDAGKLKELYSTMVKSRTLAERIHDVQTSGAGSGKTQPDCAISGLDAALVGAGAHLLRRDCVALEHGGFVASLIKGTPLRLILARSLETLGGAGGDRVSVAALNMATGLALAQALKDQGAVTVIFCTQNEEGLAFDPRAMALAATRKLPLVCLMATTLNTAAESRRARPAAVDSTYYPRIAVDGCDVVAVFRVAQEAIRRAREGHGPALIECVDMHAHRRTNGGGNSATAQDDSLSFMEQYLRQRGLWSDEWARSIVAAFNRDLDEAFAAMHEPANPGDQFDNVYSSDIARPQGESASRSNR